MFELILDQEVQVGGVDRPPPARDLRAVVENQAVGLGWGRFGCCRREACRLGWRRRGWRPRRGNTELDGLNLIDINCLRLIPDLDVKLLDVAGLDRPSDLAATLQSDDIGEELAAGQQAELPQDKQRDSSHNHISDLCGFTFNT